MLHVSNYWFIWHGYDGSPAGTVPYWSLAVEEHFYLIFPMLFLTLRRFLSNRSQARALWAVCAVVCLWRCLLVFHFGASVDRTYMGSDTRFDSILFGSAMAVGLNPMLDQRSGSERLWKYGLLPAGLMLLLLTFSYRAPWFRETFRYTLQGIGLTPLFVAAVRFPKWLPFRFLNLRPVAFVGLLSYSLYLVHQVVMYWLGVRLSSVDLRIRDLLALGLSFLIALAIHHWIERPAARVRRRLARH
jgi:peptidoglycan/LPS O-acetylase OafA/YrhL